MVPRFIYRAMFVLSAISLLSPIARFAFLSLANIVAPVAAHGIMEFPVPFSSLEMAGSNPILFGAFFPGFNAIVKAIFIYLVVHRLYYFVRYRSFIVPTFFGGTLLFASLIGCFSFFAGFAMVTFAALTPGASHLAQLAVPVSMGVLFLPLTFAVSELFLLRDGTFSRWASVYVDS